MPLHTCIYMHTGMQLHSVLSAAFIHTHTSSDSTHTHSFICKHSHICALSHMHSTHSNTYVHAQNCLQLSLPGGTPSPREARHCSGSGFSPSSIAADVMPPIQVDSEISDGLTAVFPVHERKRCPWKCLTPSAGKHRGLEFLPNGRCPAG